MRAWPTFHRDGRVTVHGDIVGWKGTDPGDDGFWFTCTCGSAHYALLARDLRGIVSAHIETREHLNHSPAKERR